MLTVWQLTVAYNMFTLSKRFFNMSRFIVSDIFIDFFQLIVCRYDLLMLNKFTLLGLHCPWWQEYTLVQVATSAQRGFFFTSWGPFELLLLILISLVGLNSRVVDADSPSAIVVPTKGFSFSRDLRDGDISWHDFLERAKNSKYAIYHTVFFPLIIL